MPDKKALKILFGKYWSSAYGWQNNPVSAEDLFYAKCHGVMFDDESIGHDASVQRCVDVCAAVSKEVVVQAFLASLTTRRLDWRSALASYACGSTMKLHTFSEFSASDGKYCTYCGAMRGPNIEDLNILSFERHKFGGVRHLQPTYIGFDLSRFAQEEVPASNQADIETLKAILVALRTLKSTKKSDSEKALAPVMKGNKDERQGIITILGYCGVLNISVYKPFHQEYIRWSERQHSSQLRSDWPFPTDLWNPSLGLSEAAIDFWFGDCLRG